MMFAEDDVILHKPSGEHWVVNRMVDCGKRVECKGWPRSTALASDCEFVRKWAYTKKEPNDAK